MRRTVGVAAIVAMLAAGAILIGIELSKGARTYGSVELQDPCDAREPFPGEGFEATLQRVALDGIDGAACTLELGREELVLSFVPDVAPEEVEWTDEVIAEALQGGFDRAIDEAEGRGTLGGTPANILREAVERAPLEFLVDGGSGIAETITDGEGALDPEELGAAIKQTLLGAIDAAEQDGSLGRIQAFALREVVERLPAALFTEVGLSVAETLSDEPFPWARDTVIEAVRSGILTTIDRAEAEGELPAIAAAPLREIVKRAPISQLIGIGETVAGFLN